MKQKGFHSALVGSNSAQTFQFKENQFVHVHCSDWFVTSQHVFKLSLHKYVNLAALALMQCCCVLLSLIPQQVVWSQSWILESEVTLWSYMPGNITGQGTNQPPCQLSYAALWDSWAKAFENKPVIQSWVKSCWWNNWQGFLLFARGFDLRSPYLHLITWTRISIDFAMFMVLSLDFSF